MLALHMASREFEALMKHLKPGLAVPDDPLEVVRAKMAKAHAAPVVADARVERMSVGGLDAAWISAPGHERSSRVLLHVKGGAFVSCGVDDYRNYGFSLSKAVSARVLVFAYRLAPEHPFPCALDDAIAAYRWLLDQGIAPSRIGVTGDSCGGGIAVAMLVSLRDAGVPLPAAAASLSGWFDLEATGDAARHPLGVDPFVDPEWIRRRGRDYVGPRGDPRHPLASPLHARLHGLPPLFLNAGQIDAARDDATRLAAVAARDGVAVTLDVWPEMIHGFQGMAGLLPEARGALRRVGAFFAEHIP
jgi:acetyl esterase/lipase